MGFKDFCKEEKNKESQVKTDSANDSQNVEDIYNKYKDKGEDELVSELFKNINKQKQDGIFNYEGLCNMVEKMSPFLTREQSLKIKQLLRDINNS